jgi:hypothetical protein
VASAWPPKDVLPQWLLENTTFSRDVIAVVSSYLPLDYAGSICVNHHSLEWKDERTGQCHSLLPPSMPETGSPDHGRRIRTFAPGRLTLFGVDESGPEGRSYEMLLQVRHETALTRVSGEKRPNPRIRCRLHALDWAAGEWMEYDAWITTGVPPDAEIAVSVHPGGLMQMCMRVPGSSVWEQSFYDTRFMRWSFSP